MDVSSYLSGSYLTHLDLPLPQQLWTITSATQQLVGGTDSKICIGFAEFPSKLLALNKGNLRKIAQLYSTQADAWQGKQLQVYRSKTEFSGKPVCCIRLCGPTESPQEPVVDQQGNLVELPSAVVLPQVPQQPAAMPQPVAPPQVTGWPTGAENNPPSE